MTYLIGFTVGVLATVATYWLGVFSGQMKMKREIREVDEHLKREREVLIDNSWKVSDGMVVGVDVGRNNG